MPTGTKETTKAQRVLKFMVFCRQHVAHARTLGLRQRDDIVTQTMKTTRRRALENFDVLHGYFIESAALSDKRAARRGVDTQTGQFVLGELFLVAYSSDNTLQLERAELTLEDGDQITKQKKANIQSAIRAFKEWDWEWGNVVRPLIVANPGWKYRDAYEYLLSHGGVPVSPSFSDDDDGDK
jgi:hypothetical protein